MKRVVVASRNPVKVTAVREGMTLAMAGRGEVFEVEGVEVGSGVADQPMTDQETLQGAENRARAAREKVPAADFWAGVEGGVDERGGKLEAFAWIVIIRKDGRAGRSRTGTFELPARVAELVKQGVELGHADDRVFGRENSKQGNGAVGLLTNDVIDRASYYSHAVVLAMIPFVKGEYYGG